MFRSFSFPYLVDFRNKSRLFFAVLGLTATQCARCSIRSTAACIAAAAEKHEKAGGGKVEGGGMRPLQQACVCLEKVKGKGYLEVYCPWHYIYCMIRLGVAALEIGCPLNPYTYMNEFHP